MVKVKEDLTGRRFGRLVVLKQAEDYVTPKGLHCAAWWVQCDCGSEPFVVAGSDLKRKNGGTKSCGCIRKERPNGRAKTKENLIGERFGRLVVIDRADDYVCKDGKHEVQWLCQCDCGNTCIVRGYALRRGTSTSCGCYIYEIKTIKQRKQNKYDLNSREYGVGYTSKGEEFWFDKEDYDLIKDYCWHYGTGGYLVTTPRKEDKTKNNIQFHRLVMGVLDQDWKEVIVDHIKHERMDKIIYDNRKQNLRIIDRTGNNRNVHIRKDNTSGVTGVAWDARNQKWDASICVNKKNISLGSFDNFEDAVRVRKEAQKEHFGEFEFEYSQQLNEKGEK